MENNNNNKKKTTGLLLAFLGVFSLVLITVGVTYAFFNYTKEGTKTNTLSTGTITFIYNEDSNRFQISDALPKADNLGAAQLGSAGPKFEFSVVSTTPSTSTIDYVVTARSYTSEIAGSSVKMALTATQTGTNYTTATSGVYPTFSTLPIVGSSTTLTGNFASIVDDLSTATGYEERVLFTGTVPASSTPYTNDFDFTMWLVNDGSTGAIDYSPYEFVKTSAVTTAGTDPIDADAAITAGDFITSTAYYRLDSTNRALYQRIGAVNNTTRQVYAVGQLTGTVNQTTGTTVYALPSGAADTWELGEQFYQYNGRTFTTTINVYADGVVSGQSNTPVQP